VLLLLEARFDLSHHLFLGSKCGSTGEGAMRRMQFTTVSIYRANPGIEPGCSKKKRNIAVVRLINIIVWNKKRREQLPSDNK